MTSDRAPRGHPGARGAADRAVPVRPGRRGGHARARGAHGDPRQARAARRRRGRATTCSPRSPAASTTSVRALEGALIRVVAYASMRERAAHAGARPARAAAGSAPTSARTSAASARSSRRPPRSSASTLERPTGSRPAPAGRPRPARRHVPRAASSPSTAPREIGKAIGERDHTTVHHAVNADRTARSTATSGCAQLRRTTCAGASADPRHDRLGDGRITSLSPSGFPRQAEAAPHLPTFPTPNNPYSDRQHLLKLSVSRETFLARLGVAVRGASTRGPVPVPRRRAAARGGRPRRAAGHRHGARRARVARGRRVDRPARPSSPAGSSSTSFVRSRRMT